MNRVNDLNDLLIDCLIQDLMDPEKRGPGLYQVVARVVNDNKSAEANAIPVKAETLDAIIPFKLKKA
jgi:hypothetical protein